MIHPLGYHRAFRHRLFRRLARGDITSITFDVFDTVLLRDVWPEGLQFLEVAKKWLPLFSHHAFKELTSYELYAWREYARRELIATKTELAHTEYKETDPEGGRDVDVSLEEWFSALVELLQAKYHVRLSDQDHAALVRQMMHEELATEKQHLRANAKLAKIIRRVRRQYPDIKIYFISDMYLSSDQIKELLTHCRLHTLFDGGITSSEVQRAKHSGKLYHYLHSSKHFAEDFDLFRNVHIGDSRHSDVAAAIIAGSSAFHYGRHRGRRIKARLGALKLRRIQQRVRTEEEKRVTDALRHDAESSADTLRSLGLLFSQPLAVFLLHVGFMARHAGDLKQYVLVSSEAEVFARQGASFFRGYFGHSSHMIQADRLNRRMIIRACAWAIAKYDRPEMVSSIVQTIRYGEVRDVRKEVYRFFFGSEYPMSEMVLNQQSDEDFIKSFYKDIKEAKPRHVAQLKEAYDYVHSLLPPHKDQAMVVVDVGWGGTVQALFGQFMELHGYTTLTEGMYLGCHPADRFPIERVPMVGVLMPNVTAPEDRGIWNPIIWEYVYTNKPQFFEDAMRLHHINKGFKEGVELFRHTQLDPVEYFRYAIRPAIKRLLTHPTRKEIETIGTIRFDQGFVNQQVARIIDLQVTTRGMYGRLLRNPKRTLQIITSPNSWTAAYIIYYHLHGLRPFLRLAGKIRHHSYI